jgi:hypothetical protein
MMGAWCRAMIAQQKKDRDDHLRGGTRCQVSRTRRTTRRTTLRTAHCALRT